jgi:hypothetical protein
MNFDYAIHSDYLIHWTGKDLDEKDEDNNPVWCKPDEDKSKTTDDETKSYIKRLHDILEYGLWMTEEYEESLYFDGTSISIPNTPKTCFTELKVSESRKHARQYGRLGIGIKRPFVFRRFGRPLIYYGFHKKLNNDKFLWACVELDNKDLLNFFKPMNRSNGSLTYDFYAESEWRIIFFKELLIKGLIKDPRDTQNEKENKYFNKLTLKEQTKLKYLIPLNGWFAMIIYPSLAVKNKAQQDDTTGIKQEIKRIKNLKDHGNKVEGKNWPIEVNLDACRNF